MKLYFSSANGSPQEGKSDSSLEEPFLERPSSSPMMIHCETFMFPHDAEYVGKTSNGENICT